MQKKLSRKYYRRGHYSTFVQTWTLLYFPTDPKQVLVTETFQEDVEEVCDSVSILSLTSSPASVNDCSMVSPDKTMLSPRTMTATSPSPEWASSKHQSRTGDVKKCAVRCLDKDLESTQQTAAPRTE